MNPRDVPVERWLEFFWKNVERKAPDECWPWIGTRNPGGRGVANFAKCSLSAPRLALLVRDGKWPEKGILACHACDQPSCVNPAHIWPGTYGENSQDMVRKGRHGNAKLTVEQVKEIRLRLSEGRTVTETARHFAVSLPTICEIRDRVTWSAIQ